MRDPKSRRRTRRVQIGDKGTCGSIRLLMEPRNHAVSYRGVSLDSAFVSDLDILGVAAVCRQLRRTSD